MQKRLSMLAWGFAALLGWPAAQAATYTAMLSGLNESPPNVSAGSGSGAAVLDTVAHTLRVTVVFSGLDGATTASHIHCCVAAPGNVLVATMTPSFSGFPLGVTAGTYDQTFDTTQSGTWNPAFITANGGTPSGAEAALAAGMAAGQAYLNIHSTLFPGGEIRGFLAPQAIVAAAPVPAVSPWLSGVMGLLVAGSAWVVLRRRGAA